MSDPNAYIEVRQRVLDELNDLREKIDRRNVLIKRAEWVFDSGVRAHVCPWCEGLKTEQHSSNCPMFTPDGFIR